MTETAKCKFCWAVIPSEAETCPKCGSDLRPPPETGEFDAGRPWFIVVRDEQKGPLSFSEVEELIRRGSVSAKNLVRQEGETDWSPAARFFNFESLSPAVSPSASTPHQSEGNQCPKCGSWNIQRLSMYLAEQKAQKKSGGSGCLLGCLLVLILFLIAPGYCVCTAVGAGAGAGYLLSEYWWLIVLGLLVAAAVSVIQYFFFICKMCGHKFVRKGRK